MRLAQLVKKGDLQARETMIEGNAGFAYKRAIKYASKSKGWSHIDGDDILQAAMMGLIDAVDRYEPDKGFAFTTYANFWLIKRIDEEISANHWTTVRPPRNQMRDFLYRKFDYDRSGEYMSKFMPRESASEIDYSQYEDQGYAQSEIDDAIARCNLSQDERRIYDAVYGDNPNGDDLTDLTKKEIALIEEGMLNKIREQFDE